VAPAIRKRVSAGIPPQIKQLIAEALGSTG
jgi:hypothetical protein